MSRKERQVKEFVNLSQDPSLNPRKKKNYVTFFSVYIHSLFSDRSGNSSTFETYLIILDFFFLRFFLF